MPIFPPCVATMGSLVLICAHAQWDFDFWLTWLVVATLLHGFDVIMFLYWHVHANMGQTSVNSVPFLRRRHDTPTFPSADRCCYDSCSVARMHDYTLCCRMSWRPWCRPYSSWCDHMLRILLMKFTTADNWFALRSCCVRKFHCHCCSLTEGLPYTLLLASLGI